MSRTVEHDGTPAIRCEDRDGVRTITLNRPDKLNAINMPMILQLEETIRSAQDADDVQVIRLRGAGRAFCAGDDVKAQAEICLDGEASLRAQLSRLQNISLMLTLGQKITVAEIHGFAIGAGLSWVLNCDFRVWGETARAFFPEVGFGAFVTGGAAFLLPRLTSVQIAAELLFLGTQVSPADPRMSGLVHSSHPPDELVDAASALACRLAALPQPAARSMKRLFGGDFGSAFRAALDAEVEACVATTLNPQTLERMRSAIEAS